MFLIGMAMNFFYYLQMVPPSQRALLPMRGILRGRTVAFLEAFPSA